MMQSTAFMLLLLLQVVTGGAKTRFTQQTWPHEDWPSGKCYRKLANKIILPAASIDTMKTSRQHWNKWNLLSHREPHLVQFDLVCFVWRFSRITRRHSQEAACGDMLCAVEAHISTWSVVWTWSWGLRHSVCSSGLLRVFSKASFDLGLW